MARACGNSRRNCKSRPTPPIPIISQKWWRSNRPACWAASKVWPTTRQSLVARHADRNWPDVTERLKEAEVTDHITGLMNRREMERQIDLRKAVGRRSRSSWSSSLIGEVGDEIAQQVAMRLTSQFRHQDLICRWSDYEFLVLFKGAREIARSRTEQIVPWIAGKYVLDDGTTVEIGVEAGLRRAASPRNAVT